MGHHSVVFSDALTVGGSCWQFISKCDGIAPHCVQRQKSDTVRRSRVSVISAISRLAKRPPSPHSWIYLHWTSGPGLRCLQNIRQPSDEPCLNTRSSWRRLLVGCNQGPAGCTVASQGGRNVLSQKRRQRRKPRAFRNPKLP